MEVLAIAFMLISLQFLAGTYWIYRITKEEYMRVIWVAESTLGFRTRSKNTREWDNICSWFNV
jgi:hypothetical protein